MDILLPAGARKVRGDRHPPPEAIAEYISKISILRDAVRVDNAAEAL
jgi:hypothetical protein